MAQDGAAKAKHGAAQNAQLMLGCMLSLRTCLAVTHEVSVHCYFQLSSS
jgi:hypothetical protein